MSFLAITIPISLLLGAIFLVLVIREVRAGAFDDLEGPAHRMVFDDDEVPESPGEPGPRP